MNVLVHVCCAPCFAYPLYRLRQLEHDVAGFWFNPNIHPYMEYRARREALEKFAELEGVDIIYESYDPVPFLRTLVQHPDRPGRCRLCYAHRLEATAQRARKRGFDAFTTTLLVSEHQNHRAVRQAGEEAARRHGVSFLYEDFRTGNREGAAVTKTYGLYRQKYCGCLLSEWERFGGKRRVQEKTGD
jgi:hypothetical protein